MAFLDWTTQYDLGVTSMDAQHKALVASMNALHARAEAGAPGDELLRLVDSLADLTQRHFAAEEEHMERIGFPGLTSHKGIHVTLLDKLATHRADVAAKGAPDEKFFAFRRFWLTSHITGIDTKYAEHGAKATVAAAR
ncbi:MAG: hemerythrin family protein [Acidimicrobiales bacterium]|nr:hemerythrin family protein [Acidimicrobiales bacterium]